VVLFAGLTFFLVAGIVLGAYWAFIVRPEHASESALRKRIGGGFSVRKSIQIGVQQEAARLSAVPILNRLLSSRSAISAPIGHLVEQSGVKTTVGVVLLASATFGLAGLLLGRAMTGWVSVGALLAVVLAALPTLFLKWKRSRRVNRFEELFPEALTLMTRAMRAGHTFVAALGMVADEMPQPIAGEFKLLHDRQNFGFPLAEALRDFGARVPVLPARFFATAVLTQRETGGNLSEVLDNLATVIRDRFTVLRQVKTKSAHGRLTGWVLTGLPPVAAAAIAVINPGHFAIMFEEPAGIRMFAAAVVLQVIGALIIRKLVRIEY
jgi:tight adherence protein B